VARVLVVDVMRGTSIMSHSLLTPYFLLQALSSIKHQATPINWFCIDFH
jgi:hypothetical protein